MGGRASVPPFPFSASFPPPRPLVMISGPTQLSFSSSLHGLFPPFSSCLLSSSCLISFPRCLLGAFLSQNWRKVFLPLFFSHLICNSLSPFLSSNTEELLMCLILLLLFWRQTSCNRTFFFSFFLSFFLSFFFSPLFSLFSRNNRLCIPKANWIDFSEETFSFTIVASSFVWGTSSDPVSFSFSVSFGESPDVNQVFFFFFFFLSLIFNFSSDFFFSSFMESRRIHLDTATFLQLFVRKAS